MKKTKQLRYVFALIFGLSLCISQASAETADCTIENVKIKWKRIGLSEQFEYFDVINKKGQSIQEYTFGETAKVSFNEYKTRYIITFGTQEDRAKPRGDVQIDMTDLNQASGFNSNFAEFGMPDGTHYRQHIKCKIESTEDIITLSNLKSKL
ncbi:MAG TPA: hypothetical protein VKR58_03035 [Aquella sp.]|nr:hypothetical protein [Aquella sp.]